jgi:hypothetical protein
VDIGYSFALATVAASFPQPANRDRENCQFGSNDCVGSDNAYIQSAILYVVFPYFMECLPCSRENGPELPGSSVLGSGEGRFPMTSTHMEGVLVEGREMFAPAWKGACDRPEDDEESDPALL